MVSTVNSYAAADAAAQMELALRDGEPPFQQPPPPPPAAIVAAPPPPPVIVEPVAPPPPVIEEVLAPSDSVIDALYADFSADSEEIDFSPEELDSAMQEMEEYLRDEQANNAVMSRGVFVTIGTAMDKDQPGRAPPMVLEKGKGPLIAADDDCAKVMPPSPNPMQQP